MAVERAGTESALIDVLDRVLEKSIALNTWDRFCMPSSDPHFVVASVQIQRTYGELGEWSVRVPDSPHDPGNRPDEAGVREPVPNPKRPRAGAVSISPDE